MNSTPRASTERSRRSPKAQSSPLLYVEAGLPKIVTILPEFSREASLHIAADEQVIVIS